MTLKVCESWGVREATGLSWGAALCGIELVAIDAKRDGSHSGTPGLDCRLGVSNESIC
jgi:hypothetical protein